MLLLGVGIVAIAVVAGNEGISQTMGEVLGLLASGELTNNVVGDIMGSAYRLTGHLGDLLQQVGVLLTILHWNLLAILDGSLVLDRSLILGWNLLAILGGSLLTILDRSLILDWDWLSILGRATAHGKRDICNRLCSVGCIRGVCSSINRLSDTILLPGELGASIDGVLLLVGQVIRQSVQITASSERNLGSMVDTLSFAVVVDLPGYKRSNVSIILEKLWMMEIECETYWLGQRSRTTSCR